MIVTLLSKALKSTKSFNQLNQRLKSKKHPKSVVTFNKKSFENTDH